MKAKLYPLLLVIMIVLVAGCATTQNQWKKAESANTVEAYEEFLKQNPESDYAKKAKDKIRELRYREAVKENTIDAYQRFLEVYPEGRLSKDVLSRLKKLTHTELLQALRSVKTVKIVVNQSYDKAEDVSLPFEDWTGKLFQYAGIKVVGAEAKRYDASIEIKANGKPLGAVYSLERYEYSGASLSGMISIEIPNVQPYKKSFKAKINPPDKIGPVHLSASDAPYWEAFRAQGSFLPIIFEIMKESFGNKPLIEAIKDGSMKVKLMPAVSLENIKSSHEIKQLIITLKDKKQGGNAADALVKIGRPAVKSLIKALKDKNEEVRKNAVRALGEIKDSRAVKPLIAALNDEDKDFREIVAEALGRMEDHRVVEPLISILHNQDEDENVRWEAAASLGKIKDPRAVEPLINALRDKSRDIRSIAAAALGEINDDLGLEPLIEALKDRDKSVRRNAALALRKITGQDFGEDYKKWKKWWQENRTDSPN